MKSNYYYLVSVCKTSADTMPTSIAVLLRTNTDWLKYSSTTLNIVVYKFCRNILESYPDFISGFNCDIRSNTHGTYIEVAYRSSMASIDVIITPIDSFNDLYTSKRFSVPEEDVKIKCLVVKAGEF